MVKSYWFLISLFVFLASCSQTPPTPTVSPNTTTPSPEQPAAIASSPSPAAPQATQSAKQPSAVTQSPSPSPTFLISVEGIGEARVGMTLGELRKKLAGKAELGEDTPLMVDFNAIPVSQNGEVQYYILHFATEPLTDSDPISFLMTKNPKYRTAEGVGPETPIAQAESVYGKATLNYNTDNESREYIRFANLPGRSLSFRTNGSPGSFAGIYESAQDGSYYETQKFREDAAISSVMVDGYRPPN
jgi:hypothetical protein